jgi:hypothetical protein
MHGNTNINKDMYNTLSQIFLPNLIKSLIGFVVENTKRTKGDRKGVEGEGCVGKRRLLSALPFIILVSKHLLL